MSDLEFEWSPAKAASNAKKHGVSFEEARTVFEEEEALLIPDPEHSADEERFVLLGVRTASRLLVVIHGERGPDVIRIISSRKADRSSARRISRGEPDESTLRFFDGHEKSLRQAAEAVRDHSAG